MRTSLNLLAQSGEPLRIGVLSPLTGTFAGLGWTPSKA
jgi:hypothetical protein